MSCKRRMDGALLNRLLPLHHWESDTFSMTEYQNLQFFQQLHSIDWTLVWKSSLLNEIDKRPVFLSIIDELSQQQHWQEDSYWLIVTDKVVDVVPDSARRWGDKIKITNSGQPARKGE